MSMASIDLPSKERFEGLPMWWDNRESKRSLHGPHLLLMAGRQSFTDKGFYDPGFDKHVVDLHQVIPRQENYSISSNLCGSHASLETALVSLESGLLPLPSIEELMQIVWRCTEAKSLAFALRVHLCMHRLGLEAHRSLGNYLVTMFVKAQSIFYAQKVFDSLWHKNERSWSSLIDGYVNSSLRTRAFALYETMTQSSLFPTSHTLVALLKACTELKDMERGNSLHSDISKHGLLKQDIYVGSTLVDMYAKCGSLAKAQEVFDTLQFRDVVTWNALLTGYIQSGWHKEALQCYQRMQCEGIPPNAITYTCILKACGGIGDADKGIELHHEISGTGLLSRSCLVGGAVVDMYAKCGLLAEARAVFDCLPVRDVVSWTSLIGGYVQCEAGEKALSCFEQMQLEGVSPNAITFANTLKACGIIREASKGRQLHAEICRMGMLKSDAVLGNVLVDMYAKCGALGRAREVFDKLESRNVISWNALIAGYVQYDRGEEALMCLDEMRAAGACPNAVTYISSLKACGSIMDLEKGSEIHTEMSQNGTLEGDLILSIALLDMYGKCGMVTKAREMFDTLPTRNVVAWTALITVYTQQDLGEQALSCFEQMQADGVAPNAATFACSLRACTSLGSVERGVELHTHIDRDGLLQSNHVVGTALVDMYAKCGFLAKAQNVFDKLPVQDDVAWNSVITGYSQLGDIGGVLYELNRMRESGNGPNTVTFVSVLNACSHAGMIEEAKAYYQAMMQDHGIPPTLEHLTCVVDLLGRTGQLDAALGVTKEAPHDLNSVVWLTLLAACRNSAGYVDVARQAFQQAVCLDEEEGAVYICMYNICAETDMQE